MIGDQPTVVTAGAAQLSWRAEHRDAHHGKTAADFGMGLKKPPLSAIQVRASRHPHRVCRTCSLCGP